MPGSQKPCTGQRHLSVGRTGNIRISTLKLLHTYNDVQGQQGENAETIRRDIAGILHTLNQAYENLYNNLLSDVVMDISSEIAALQGMLANDGLTGREFE